MADEGIGGAKVEERMDIDRPVGKSFVGQWDQWWTFVSRIEGCGGYVDFGVVVGRCFNGKRARGN